MKSSDIEDTSTASDNIKNISMRITCIKSTGTKNTFVVRIILAWYVCGKNVDIEIVWIKSICVSSANNIEYLKIKI